MATAKNVIFMVADGFGANQISAYEQFKGAAPIWKAGALLGVKTSSASNYITDSAASATAYAIGEKTFNGAIGVDVTGQAQVSVLDIASRAGKATGLVSTASIIDATPAAFAASTASRSNRNEIAQQYIDNGDLDVMLGGGRRYFTVDHDKDGKTTLQEAQDRGFEYVKDATELSNAGKDKLLGLFSSIGFDGPVGNGALGAYAAGQPSLADMTKAALAKLSKNDKGFFLVVEEEGTDTFGHDNDASTVFHSAASFEKAVEVALEFVKNNPDTLLITTADHETGGMQLGYLSGGSVGNPAIYRGFQATYEGIFDAIQKAVAENPQSANDTKILLDTVRAVVLNATGGAVNLSDTEAAQIAGSSDALTVLRSTLNNRGGVSFTTGGHRPDDVPLFAFGAGADLRSGTIDNTDVASWLAEAMGLALPAVETHDGSDANTLVFRNGLNGYNGTRDTTVGSPEPDTLYGDLPINYIDGPVATPYQMLIRFDDLVGAGVHQIASDAQITSATLELRVSNSGNAVSVHRMLTDWNEESTWNSLSNGIAADGVEAAANPVVTTSGNVKTGLLSLDVTAAVKAWQADPTANFGLVILPTGSDGVDIYSSESVAKAAPVLRVTVDKKNQPQLVGTPGNDALTGDAGNDVIRGLAGDDTLDGGDGNDRIDGGAGNDKLAGGAGDDVLKGAAGDDLSEGGAGFDTLDLSDATGSVSVNWLAGTAAGGGIGSDRFTGIESVLLGAGDDRLRGSSADEAVDGGAGKDTLDGGAGKDVLAGGAGDDALKGGSGDDALEGEEGEDLLEGGSGNDLLWGGAGDDNLKGGSGDDALEGGAGRDLLSGGSGHDVFVFGKGFGRDVISDFAASGAQADMLEFAASVLADYAAFTAAATQSGRDVVITLDAETTLTLSNVTLAALQADDFRFV